MKKILVVILLIPICVYALSNNFTIDPSLLSFSSSGKKNTIVDSFNQDYNLTAKVSFNNSKLEKKIETLTKKATYLLLGDFNTTNESSEENYKRYQEYLKLMYNPKLPKDDSTLSGYDEDSEEYKDYLLSSYVVPNMFLAFDERGVVYGSYGNIVVQQSGDLVMSAITLPNVTIKEESNEDPMKYNRVQTNLTIYYVFKELKGEYKLYYLMGETSDELNDYFLNVEDKENNATMQIAPVYNSNLKDVYDYSKLEAITNDQLNNIYVSNVENIVMLNSYYNNYLVASACGFFINDGLIVTTWDFLNSSLMKAQFMAVKDMNGNSYDVDGIVTVNPETDIVVIKLKEKSGKKVNLGNSSQLRIEDPVVTISSKGVGFTLQSGIVISTDGYISTTIPLVTSDEGSPLFDSSGKVVGMNTSKQVNSSVSMTINSNVLKEVQDKFNKISFDNIDVISFDKLKENYYVEYGKENVKNDIPKNKWEKYSKIGNIEKNINLELVKASYHDGIMSLRYHNGISDFVDNMQFAGAFKDQLISDGFEEKLSSSTKCVYTNNKYQVIIMSEFDYLIVVMVKL